MAFKKYQSLKQLGKKEVRDINVGRVYLFTKLDGSNSSTYTSHGEVRAGSRNRELDCQNDNAGFCKYVESNQDIQNFHKHNPKLRLYGEWLVPHVIKDYKDDAWRKFYVFDVIEELENEEFRYLTYEEYKPLLESYNIEYVPLLAMLDNPTEQEIANYIKDATFLLKDGGKTEGIVAKRYDFKDRYGHTTWAKYINKEFTNGSTKHKTIKIPNAVELAIVERMATQHLIEKEFAKIVNEVGEWKPKYINRIFEVVYYCVITEELDGQLWDILKEFKNPTIDFYFLKLQISDKVREVLGDKLMGENL